MPLRRLVVERKKKSKKLRPPRIYKRKGVKYIRPGKNKIKVSDVNLIINNHIASRSRGGYQRGAQHTRALQKKAKDIMEERSKAKQIQAELTRVNEEKLAATRAQQIAEKALAIQEGESKAVLTALEKKHANTLERERDRFAAAYARADRDIERKGVEIDKAESILADLLRESHGTVVNLSEERAYRRGIDNEVDRRTSADKVSGIQRKRTLIRNAIIKKAAKLGIDIEFPILPEYDNLLSKYPEVSKIKNLSRESLEKIKAEAVQIKAANFKLPDKHGSKPALPPAEPPGARAAADPIIAEPDVEENPIPPVSPVAIAARAKRKNNLGDIGDDDAVIPIITSRGKKRGGPCGMSNYQIDAAMEDEPMYLKTISADQISDLDIMANLALDEYKQCGFIVNVDPLGVVERQHWTAVYIDCDEENVCYYYDSFGEPPTILIAAGLKSLINKLDIPHYLAFEYNTVVNQDENSSRCGIHCILTLTDLFAGMSTELASDHSEGAAKAFQHYI